MKKRQFVKKGEKYGRLLIISERFICKYPNGATYTSVTCRCDCGVVKNIASSNLTTGNSLSCGCLGRDMLKKRATKHGYHKRPLYKTWKSMIERCTNENHYAYNHYGARGIDVSDEWLSSFECFEKDMGQKPTPSHSLDRIDNNKGYSKDNCRWATMKEQSNNRRSSKPITYNGVTYLRIEDLAIAYNINKNTLASRIRRLKDISISIESEVINRKKST